jgi:hypothetical protein
MLETLTGALVEAISTADDRREWAASRPSRSVPSVRAAVQPPRAWRAFAECVLRRESGATLDRQQSGVGARNTSSSASGRWQMLDASGWRDGGAWNVQKRLVRFGATRAQAREVRVYLQRTPIYRWNGIWQDMAAFEALQSGGWRHWYAPGSPCNDLVPAGAR